MRQSAEGIILRLTLFLLALRLSLQQRAGRSDPTTGCLSFDNQHSFIQHCSSADDCTSEDEFCPCCREYGRRSDWAQACIAFCGERVFAPPARDRHIGTGLATAGTTLAETDSWRIDDFGKSDLPQTERSERGFKGYGGPAAGESDSESDASDVSASDEEDQSWISWCGAGPRPRRV